MAGLRGLPRDTHASVPGTEKQFDVRREAVIHSEPSQASQVLDRRNAGGQISGVEEEHVDGIWVHVSVDGVSEGGWVNTRTPLGEYVLQPVEQSPSQDADNYDLSSEKDAMIGRTTSAFQRAAGADQDFGSDLVGSPATNLNIQRTRNAVRRPLSSRAVRMTSMTNALNEHSLKDSDQVCVGATTKLVSVPRGARCLPINPVFLAHIEFAVRGGLGALIAALPALLTAEWVRYPFSTFDLTFGAVAFVFTFSHSMGETTKYIFQAMAGATTAAIVPQLAINTFGHEDVPVLLFMMFYSWAVLSLPVEPFTKKFALGMCIHYLMMYHALPPDGNIEKKTTYQVVLLGMYGCFVAMFMNVYPYPRSAIGNAFTGIRRCITDIQFCTRNLVEGYLNGENLQDRARTLKYFEHLTTELRTLDQALADAWWEPWAMQSGRVHKYRAVTLLIHKLRTDLFGMQKALMERVRDDLHVEVMQKNTFKMKNNQVDDDSIQEFQEGIRHLMFTSLRTLRSVVLYVAGDQEKEWSGQVARQSREKMKKNIQTDISELKVLELALERFHHDYSQLRRELSTRPDEDRIERDKWLNVFLFNLTSYSQALMDFPSDYATGLEQAQSDKHIFLPESKMVVLSFQKRQLISAGKTAAAITSAAFINMRFKFNNQQLSPVLIAYVMGGHVGGSWANTANRVLGLIVGMIMAFFFTIFSECNSYALGAGFAVVITLSFYVRDASRSHSYAGAVAAFVECLIMVGPCETETTLQLDMVEQIVLSCLLISVAEIFMASSSDLFFRKQVADTLLDCLSVFKEVFDAHVSVNLESLTMRTKKDVDAALWRNLPGSLHKQEEFLAQSLMEPALWAAEAPHSAYQKLIYSGRRLNLHLILLHRAFVRMDVLRHNTEHVDAFREQKLLLDDLVGTLSSCACLFM